MKRVVRAACPHDCPDACGVLITVQDGRATKIQGDPEHPVTRGFLCAKVAKYLDRVYSPDRVLYPMRRVGPKGPQRAIPLHAFETPTSGKGGQKWGTPVADGVGHIDTSVWERISWDEALSEITSRFRAISTEFG